MVFYPCKSEISIHEKNQAFILSFFLSQLEEFLVKLTVMLSAITNN